MPVASQHIRTWQHIHVGAAAAGTTVSLARCAGRDDAPADPAICLSWYLGHCSAPRPPAWSRAAQRTSNQATWRRSRGRDLPRRHPV